MRLLITGGAGFIGSNLIHHVLHLREGVPARSPGCCPGNARYAEPSRLPGDVRVLNVDSLTYAGDLTNLDGVSDDPAYAFEKADICDASAVDDLVRRFEPDVILHLAAESHVDRSIADGTVFARTNVVGTQVLLDVARRHDVRRFVQVSTDEVYGSIERGSFSEDDPYDPSSPYSASKGAGDLLVRAHHKTYGTPAVVTRCTNNYGPRQHPEKLVPKMITLALADRPLPIYGDGRNVRDWIYVKDHCHALITLLGETSFEGNIYNIAGKDERDNLDVVHTILDLLGKPRTLIQFIPDRPGHDRRYSLDDAKIRSRGWQPKTRFEDGIRDTVAGILAKMGRPTPDEYERVMSRGVRP